MSTDNKQIAEMIKVLDMIADDMKNDAANFDGQSFNGKVVATYFGYHGAAITALAKITKLILKHLEKKDGI
jgi:hypothetical protein